VSKNKYVLIEETSRSQLEDGRFCNLIDGNRLLNQANLSRIEANHQRSWLYSS